MVKWNLAATLPWFEYHAARFPIAIGFIIFVQLTYDQPPEDRHYLLFPGR
jgi:hypothetical protein